MSLRSAKLRVTRYFRGRGAALRLLSNKGLPSSSDYFELYVLVRLAQRGKGKVVPSGKNSRGDSVFLIAGAPSPSWKKASFIEIKGLAARTGLEVQCTPGSVELDVVLVDPAQVDLKRDEVPAKAAVAGFECKALSGKMKTTHANEIIGKAHRVWCVPVVSVGKGKTQAPRYTAVALNGTTAGLGPVLSAAGIGLAESLAKIEDGVRNLIDALP